jgi:hypothetical protein
MAALRDKRVILVIDLKLSFAIVNYVGGCVIRLFTDELLMTRTIHNTQKTDEELWLPLDAHTMVNILQSPLLDTQVPDLYDGPFIDIHLHHQCGALHNV